jgi:hypothetical protein
MDTDELSTESYKGIIIEAEKFNHDLTLQFGVMAASCENEAAYLVKAKKLIGEIKLMNKADYTDIFFDIIPDKNALHLCLQKISDNISEVEKIPEAKRHYEF